jgi:hypothetical protein
MDLTLTDRIRERAYYLWLASGGCDGDAEQHWLIAEREILQSGKAASKISNAVSPAIRPVSRMEGRPLSRATPRALTHLVN